MARFVSDAFDELKKQVESLGLDANSKSKFLIEEWHKIHKAEAEEKKTVHEAAAEETRLRAEGKVAAREKRA